MKDKEHTSDVNDFLEDFGYPRSRGFTIYTNDFDEVYLSCPAKYNYVFIYLNINTKYCDYELELDSIKERHNNRDKLKAALDVLSSNQNLQVTENMLGRIQRDGENVSFKVWVNIPDYDEDVELECIVKM